MNKTMSKLIFCKFLDHDGNPRGRDYTYRSDIEVAEGELVEVLVERNDGEPRRKKVMVTKAEVQPEEIPGYEAFQAKIKTIRGVWVDEE